MIKIYEKDGYEYFEIGSRQFKWKTGIFKDEEQMALMLELFLNSITGTQDKYLNTIDFLMEKDVSE